jgi:glycosyltransferase involved in cell wall biosynthesis
VRVLLLLQSLDGGGAERVAVNLINRWDPRVVDARIGLLRRDGPYLAEVDPDRLTAPARVAGRTAALARAPLEIARMIRRDRPEVVMTFGLGTDLLAWPALRALGAARPNWICRGDSNPDAEIGALRFGPLGRGVVRAAARRAHRSADGVVAVARDLAARIDADAHPASPRAQVIYNPIDVARIRTLAKASPPIELGRPFIVAAGRLVRQKGYDLLIKAFAESAAARGADLVILGEGPLEGALKAQAAALGVGDRVRFPGFQANPWAWFASARLFVLSSRWEGFGNVVAEALACGAPTLVTDCDFGPREQVVHGVNGWVVRTEDPAALTAGLDILLGEPVLAARLAKAGRVRAWTFDGETIAAAYAAMFQRQAASRAASRGPFSDAMARREPGLVAVPRGHRL